MEVKPGYKQTEAGIIPEEWDVSRIGTLCAAVLDCHHSTPVWTTSGSIVIRNQNIRDGKLDLSQPSFTDEIHFAERTRRAVPSFGDLVITREAPMGLVCMIPEGLKCCLGQRMVLLRPNHEAAETEYLLYALLSEAVQRSISVAGGTGSTVSNLRIPVLRGLEIPAPPLPEQRAIAEALSDVDALLGGLDRLVAKKRDLKQAAMQQLLTGQTRLPGFYGEWEVKRLGELLVYEQPTKYLVSSSEYSDTNDIPVLTAGKTFILGYTNEDDGIFSNLPVIIFDDFTTANKYVTFPFKAKSSAMKLLRPRNPSVNLRLIYEMMQLIEFKLSEHKRYWISEYQKLEIKMPDEKEQTAIAAVLSDMDAELAALEQRRDKTRDLKQAMMQELLTGRTRLV